jgi:hypothetical protein
MAITYHDSASTPADNGTGTATTVAVTPPASMVTGDLVVMYGYQRGTATMSISATGGQSWNTFGTGTSAVATLAYGVFWCRWNGTWATNPSILFSAGTNTNVVMHVFRPTDSGKSWAFEAQSTGGFIDYSGAVAQSIGPAALSNASTVTIASWMSHDDNTWGTLTGSGWISTGTAQYRNTSGNDTSSTYAHNIRTTAGTPANVSKTQLTLGDDPGVKTTIAFYEFDPPTFTSRPMTLLGVG